MHLTVSFGVLTEPTSARPIVTPSVRHFFPDVTELPADNVSIITVPELITDGTPVSHVEYNNGTFMFTATPNQPNSAIFHPMNGAKLDSEYKTDYGKDL